MMRRLPKQKIYYNSSLYFFKRQITTCFMLLDIISFFTILFQLPDQSAAGKLPKYFERMSSFIHSRLLGT